MKSIHLPWLPLALLATVAPTAQAMWSGAEDRVEIVAPRATDEPMPDALRDLDAQFAMSDGRRLAVTSAGGTAVQLHYGHGRRAWLAHAGGGRYVSPSGHVALQIDIDAAGDPTTARLTMPASWQ